MNTINLEKQNQIDDLRIQRAIAGLSAKDQEALRDLIGRTPIDPASNGDADTESSAGSDIEFNDFEHCVALVDVWLAEHSEVTLNSDQRTRLLDQFGGGSPDRLRGMRGTRRASRIRKTSPDGRWFLVSALVAASLCLVLASTLWVNHPESSQQKTLASAAELRQQMLEDPPADMLRWAWNDQNVQATELHAEPVFMGDVIWSDLLQKGYALLRSDAPVADPALYQLRLFQMIEDKIGEGVICSEFRFDEYTTPFVIVIRPDTNVKNPQRFTVGRSPEEPAEISGPNDVESVALFAEATPAETVMLDPERSEVEDSNAIISSESPAF